MWSPTVVLAWTNSAQLCQADGKWCCHCGMVVPDEEGFFKFIKTKLKLTEITIIGRCS